MKNSTTALILLIMCVIGNLIKDDGFMFVAAAIFAATFLIINTIDKDK